MGLMAPKIESAEALSTIAKEASRPWYKRAEIWIAAIATFLAVYAIYQNSQVIRVTERPYVSIEPWGGVDSQSIDFQSNKRILLLFRLTNNGRTPANPLSMIPKRVSLTYNDSNNKIQSVEQAGATVPMTLPAESSSRVGVILSVDEKDYEVLKISLIKERHFLL